MFSCKVCKEKDARIADLKEQIKSQQNQISPPARISKYELETDYMLDGANSEQIETPTPISEEAQTKVDEQKALIQLEYDQIISGSTW